MSTSTPVFRSFDEFYPYYLSEHMNYTDRMLHFVGTTFVMAMFVLGWALLEWRFFAFIPLVGYGFAWFGHAVFERNKPATFVYPLWSLGCDFRMWWDIVTGRIQQRLVQVRAGTAL